MSDQLAIAVNADFAWEKNAAFHGENAKWFGIAGYAALKTPTEPNLLYGAGWVNVTKDNMTKYQF